MPKVSRARIIETVNEMADDWAQIVEETGDLTPEDMHKSLLKAYRNGRPIVIAKKESTLALMNAIFIGDSDGR